MGNVIFILCFLGWLILSAVVGNVAQSQGRSFGLYFCLSLFISPIVGFIVLAIKGKASPDEILSENPHIFYCPKCNKTYSNKGDSVQTCPECGSTLTETSILATEWRAFPQEKKDSLKQEFAKGNYLRSNIGAPVIIQQQTNNADELKKYKELLDDGAITQEEYNIKKKQLLGL
jgi:ABC-type transport system involved in multi-copper enzyme maturation permease subunit